MGAARAVGAALSTLGSSLTRALLGRPLRLPAALSDRYPELAGIRWRHGGLPLRIGGWCLGQRTVAGITLGQTVFLARADPLAPALLLHEAAHARQFAQVPVFPLRYAWQSARRGYVHNAYERDADDFAARILAERPPLAPPFGG